MSRYFQLIFLLVKEIINSMFNSVMSNDWESIRSWKQSKEDMHLLTWDRKQNRWVENDKKDV